MLLEFIWIFFKYSSWYVCYMQRVKRENSNNLNEQSFARKVKISTTVLEVPWGVPRFQAHYNSAEATNSDDLFFFVWLKFFRTCFTSF